MEWAIAYGVLSLLAALFICFCVGSDGKTEFNFSVLLDSVICGAFWPLLLVYIVFALVFHKGKSV